MPLIPDFTEDAFEAFWYIHNIDSDLIDNLDIFITKVNPKTGSIDKNESLNTLVEVWLETGPNEDHGGITETPYTIHTHDPRLDVGAHTFEGALMLLAEKVKKYYVEKA